MTFSFSCGRCPLIIQNYVMKPTGVMVSFSLPPPPSFSSLLCIILFDIDAKSIPDISFVPLKVHVQFHLPSPGTSASSSGNETWIGAGESVAFSSPNFPSSYGSDAKDWVFCVSVGRVWQYNVCWLLKLYIYNHTQTN